MLLVVVLLTADVITEFVIMKQVKQVSFQPRLKKRSRSLVCWWCRVEFGILQQWQNLYLSVATVPVCNEILSSLTVRTGHFFVVCTEFTVFYCVHIEHFRLSCNFIFNDSNEIQIRWDKTRTWLSIRCSSVGLADGQYRRCTWNASWSSIWMYRIDRRLLRMRETSRCPTSSNTRRQQR